jgi:hypothetical protein
MKRIPIIALLGMASVCTAGSLQAQSHEVRANVPFNFTVGSKQLPSGSYKFFSEPNDTVVIRNNSGQIAVLSRTEEVGNAQGYSSRLVFNKYGDRYFLSEILCPSIAMDVEIPKSKLEKQVRSQQAWLGPQQVLVAMR